VDTAGNRASEWFGGLGENRLEWTEGRDFDLEPRPQIRPDLVIRGWLKVDGKPHEGIVCVLNFRPEPMTPGKLDHRSEVELKAILPKRPQRHAAGGS